MCVTCKYVCIPDPSSTRHTELGEALYARWNAAALPIRYNINVHKATCSKCGIQAKNKQSKYQKKKKKKQSKNKINKTNTKQTLQTLHTIFPQSDATPTISVSLHGSMATIWRRRYTIHNNNVTWLLASQLLRYRNFIIIFFIKM